MVVSVFLFVGLMGEHWRECSRRQALVRSRGSCTRLPDQIERTIACRQDGPYLEEGTYEGANDGGAHGDV